MINVEKYRVVIYDNQRKKWQEFRGLTDVITTKDVNEVEGALRETNDRVSRDKMYAAGFLSYDSAPAFDEAMQVRESTEFPLLWFGLFRDVVSHMEFPQQGFNQYSLGQWRKGLNTEEYRKALKTIRGLLEEGETYQVNYSYRQVTEFTGVAESLFVDMLRRQESHYGAFIETGDWTVCSGSPELFFRKEGSRLISKPMKGTTKRGLTLEGDRDQAGWLYQSEKNRAENVMIVDMVRNDMGRIAKSGTVRVPKLYSLEKYPTVWQMTSTVECETEADFPEIFKALFPCASITGAPKISTMRIIADLERSPRNIYTGSIGYMSPGGEMQFNVAIRTALINKANSTMEYGTGGGIVWDSDIEEELEEARLKTVQITDPRPDFQLLETLLWKEEVGYFLLGYHLKRISESAEYFGYDYQEKLLTEKLHFLESNFANNDYRIRLLLSENGKSQLEWSEYEDRQGDQTVPLRFAPAPVDPSNRFLYHKTTHRSMYEFGLSGDVTDGEFVLWNPGGEVTETSIANIVVRWEGELITPPVHCGLLPGTMRQYLLDAGKIHEHIVTKEMLKQAEEIYVINSVRKWRSATLIE
ncbi:MAG: Aminodeoxychorismate synthase component 1 [Candidatus Marinimicrobia bacterium]|nr:Aminodeoxychorismate synthase component 1 [Candidatus Neomarinimicrobiota bacterium]